MKVDHLVAAGRGVVDLTGPKTGNAAHLRVDDPGNQGRGHRRIDRVAAAHQYARTGFRCFGLSGNDHLSRC